MRTEMIGRYTLAWIPMVFIAIANGAIRELGYGKSMSEPSAHQISSILGVIFFTVYIWLLSLRWPLESSRQALAVGVIWVGLTVVFEFLFGHYIAKHPWSRLLYDYNLLTGRLWSLVLITITLAPYVIYSIRKK
jgi:hypothetical protein